MTAEKNETLGEPLSEKVIGGQDIDSADAQGAEGVANSLKAAQRIAEVIDDKRGRDIVILDISRQSSFADFFVNATAGNTRMLATIKNEIEDELEKSGHIIKGAEGKPDTGWVLVDCGDVIVNLFLEEQRGKYQIEKIWSDAAIIDFNG